MRQNQRIMLRNACIPSTAWDANPEWGHNDMKEARSLGFMLRSAATSTGESAGYRYLAVILRSIESDSHGAMILNAIFHARAAPQGYSRSNRKDV
jgi:hypothetical protein